MKTIRQTLDALRFKVLPWAEPRNEERIIIARRHLSAEELPSKVLLNHCQPEGERVILKGRRKHADRRLYIAHWPEDNLQEIAPPKLACILSGRADYLFGGYSLSCEPGHFLFIPPRMPHQMSGPFLAEERLASGACSLMQAYSHSRGVFLWFSHSSGEKHTSDAGANYLIHNAAAAQILNLFSEEASEGRENHKTVCNSLLHTFFALIARELQAGRYTHPGPREFAPVFFPEEEEGFANQLQKYIESNFYKPLRVGEVAAQMYISTPQFCRRVRQETGTTFVELLTRCRIKRAQELLTETDWTATAIASYIGFRSSTHFQDLFRRRVGCTPIEYREREKCQARL